MKTTLWDGKYSRFTDKEETEAQKGLVFCFCVGLGIGGDYNEEELVHYNEDNKELLGQ